MFPNDLGFSFMLLLFTQLQETPEINQMCDNFYENWDLLDWATLQFSVRIVLLIKLQKEKENYEPAW